jgi:adenylate kinase
MTDASRDVASADGERLILLLVGAVATGKGTQAEMLSTQLGLAHLASGNLFRAAIAAGTPLGTAAQAHMERGELVPDETTIAMFMDELAKPPAARGAVLDGFPRTLGQAVALDQTLERQHERIRRVIHIDVPADILVSRVAGRWMCPTCDTTYHEVTDPPQVAGVCDREGSTLIQRDDDRPEVVRARIDRQVPPMLEVLDHYRAAGIVDRVDGDQSIEAVHDEIMAALARSGVRGGS